MTAIQVIADSAKPVGIKIDAELIPSTGRSSTTVATRGSICSSATTGR